MRNQKNKTGRECEHLSKFPVSTYGLLWRWESCEQTKKRRPAPAPGVRLPAPQCEELCTNNSSHTLSTVPAESV